MSHLFDEYVEEKAADMLVRMSFTDMNPFIKFKKIIAHYIEFYKANNTKFLNGLPIIYELYDDLSEEYDHIKVQKIIETIDPCRYKIKKPHNQFYYAYLDLKDYNKYINERNSISIEEVENGTK